MIPDILERIVSARKTRVATTGRAQGIDLPSQRETPVVPFPGSVICEIKRRSPSRGDLAAAIDPVAQAGKYRTAGARSVSVLTEEAFFNGSLSDLIAVKAAHPELGVLRKDFLLDTEDVLTSWRAGADAVLLIAAILPPETLGTMLDEARRLGISALVEVHDEEEVTAVRPFKPELVGINSRDLRTFRVDLLGPLAVAEAIDWECTRVFESGIFHREDVLVARDGRFEAVLVGEAVVKEAARVSDLKEAMEGSPTTPASSTAEGGAADHSTAEGGTGRYPGAGGGAAVGGRHVGATGRHEGVVVWHPDAGPDSTPAGSRGRQWRRSSFWSTVAVRRGIGPRYRPLVKICGITNVDDAHEAARGGADLLGLIYAQSPRTVPEGLAEELRRRGIDLPLVGVVIEGDPKNADLLRRAQEDLSAGFLSALQLHGTSQPEEAIGFGWPVYKAVKFRSVDAVREVLPAIRTPRVLVDAYDPLVEGGTGKRVADEVLDEVVRVIGERPHGALWLAGGLNPDTVHSVVVEQRPELIDASSGLESEPGKKSHRSMKRYFEAINDAIGDLNGGYDEKLRSEGRR